MRTSRAPNARDGRLLVATLRSGADRATLNDVASAVTAAITAAAARHEHQVHEAIAAAAQAEPTAPTAAGGIMAPEDSDYSLPGFASTDRPVKNALPGFAATRGGVRFVRPPTLADLAGAIAVWDVNDGIAAATAPGVRKPNVRVSVDGEIVVDVQAITNSLIFGNMVARAFPEFVAASRTWRSRRTPGLPSSSCSRRSGRCPPASPAPPPTTADPLRWVRRASCCRC